uniref:Uncharacterized protein n=1 Tax=Anguilla anguilla TaxID=7936 RepID=A0A0E9VAS9_ANGAN
MATVGSCPRNTRSGSLGVLLTLNHHYEFRLPDCYVLFAVYIFRKKSKIVQRIRLMESRGIALYGLAL